MFPISFDARVREDHLIGFFVPTSVLPGSFCQFQVNITSNGTLISAFTFTATVPADRHIVFTVPSNVPLGTYHFTILCTVLSGPSGAAATSASTTPAPAAAAEAEAEAEAETEDDDDTEAEAGAQTT
jgi:hypothetical protein